MHQRTPSKRFVLSTLATAVMAATLASTAANAASFKAGDVDVTLGGYAKFDATYFDPGVAVAGTVLGAGSMPKSDSTDDANIDLTARESRFWIKTSTATEMGTVKTHIEADFYGPNGNEYVSNSNGLRIRHAYGTLNGWLMGQTWSTFMDLAHLGEIIDFGQHTSTVFVRQAQARYTHKLDNGSLMFALENPQSYIRSLNSTGTSVTGGDTSAIPDIVARWNVDGDWGHASVGVVGRQFKNTLADGNDSDFGAAVSLTGKFKLAGKDSVSVQLNGGALGRYVGLIVHPGATFKDGKIDTVDSLGASIAYRHYWTDSIRSTLLVSATEADLPTLTAAESATLFESSNSVHVNVLWDVAPKVRLGVELQRQQAKFDNGDKNELTRVQFSSRYLF